MSNTKAEGYPVIFQRMEGTRVEGTKTRQRNNMRGWQSGMQMADAVHSWNDADIIVTSCWRQGDIQIADSDVK